MPKLESMLHTWSWQNEFPSEIKCFLPISLSYSSDEIVTVHVIVVFHSLSSTLWKWHINDISRSQSSCMMLHIGRFISKQDWRFALGAYFASAYTTGNRAVSQSLYVGCLNIIAIPKVLCTAGAVHTADMVFGACGSARFLLHSGTGFVAPELLMLQAERWISTCGINAWGKNATSAGKFTV